MKQQAMVTGWQLYVFSALPTEPPGITLDEIEEKVSGLRYRILDTLKRFKRKGLVIRHRGDGLETWWRKGG